MSRTKETFVGYCVLAAGGGGGEEHAKTSWFYRQAALRAQLGGEDQARHAKYNWAFCLVMLAYSYTKLVPK